MKRSLKRLRYAHKENRIRKVPEGIFMALMEGMKTYKGMFIILGKGTHLNDKGIRDQGIGREKEAEREGIISGCMKGMTTKERREISRRDTRYNLMSLG